MLNPKEEWARDALLGLFPDFCGVACKAIPIVDSSWSDDEVAEIKNATLTRKQEFLAGRSAAREALMKLGLHNIAIPVHANRSPIWPKGFIGSISHSGKIAVAAVAHVRNLVAIGVDIESPSAVTHSLWSDIMLQSEHEFLNQLPHHQRVKYATIIFSVKEGFYKFQFPHTRTWLEFHDVKVTLDLESETCEITTAFPISIGNNQSTEFRGYYRTSDSLIMTAVFE